MEKTFEYRNVFLTTTITGGKMKTLLKISVCFVLVAIALGGAYAQFAKPEYAIKYRKSVMFLIAQHFGRMGAIPDPPTRRFKPSHLHRTTKCSDITRLRA